MKALVLPHSHNEFLSQLSRVKKKPVINSILTLFQPISCTFWALYVFDRTVTRIYHLSLYCQCFMFSLFSVNPFFVYDKACEKSSQHRVKQWSFNYTMILLGHHCLTFSLNIDFFRFYTQVNTGFKLDVLIWTVYYYCICYYFPIRGQVILIKCR